ncbi:MAG: hypothetical protein D6718_09670 [Acidobacteria bacterium]|nr:MAG: hypothetical protein D6718_09670 [Acidobacteriota bacterium]
MALVATAWAGAQEQSSCLTCHQDKELFDEEMLQFVRKEAQSVHAAAGLSCHDCHGGNPDPAVADDPGAAMDEGFDGNPYRGRPARRDIPRFCGRCHSDPDYMRRFRPDARVDQEREYWTSHHGKLLAKGDERVATCIDCHGAHGIRGKDDAESSVYPTRVAETCRSCHADPEHMRGYKTADGRPLPTDQYARWRQSVHAKALLEKGDLFAPTCNDCHGNHGANPPGIASVAFVCGQCHGREARLFRASGKHDGFQRHNEFLAEAGGEGCASCHEPGSPQAQRTDVREFSECVVCHSNHAVLRPSVAMLAPLPETPCVFCHEGINAAASSSFDRPGAKERYEKVRDGLLAQAASKNLTGEARFDWLVDRSQELEFHTFEGEKGQPRRLRPEFANLLTKFRIGKTKHVFEDPDTGAVIEERVRRCSDCHPDTPDGVGMSTARKFVEGMSQLTVVSARAERALLAARRGGVEIGRGQSELEQAVDAQIGLEVMVHTFDVSEGSEFAKGLEEGQAHAAAALDYGKKALEELQLRRRWLAVSLVVIVLVLIGLALKVRQLSLERIEQERAAMRSAPGP